MEFILGEHARTLDDRYRLNIPSELSEKLAPAGGELILAKERPGCLSLWNAESWQAKHDAEVRLIEDKMRAGKLESRLSNIQMLGRLLSTRHRSVSLAGRGRLLVPEGFREFLRVEPGGDLLVVGAAICVEIWNPKYWLKYLDGRMPRYRRLMDRLS